jgi:hypothetical protein
MPYPYQAVGRVHDDAPPPRQYMTIEQIAARHPVFSIGTIRGLVARQVENGLANYVSKVGRKIVIDATGFDEWVASQRSIYGGA